MTLPASGSITIAAIAAELEVSLPLDINASNVRSLAGVASGNITMPTDFYGKSSLTASIVEASFSGTATAFGGGSTTAYTGFATLAVAGGGTGAITYQWHVTGGAGITASTSSTTRLALSGTAGASISGTVWCVVTREGVSRTTATKTYELSIIGDEPPEP